MLRAGGLLALFWNAPDREPGIVGGFADVYEKAMPGSRVAQFYRQGSAADGYWAFLAQAEAGIAASGAIGAPKRWRFDWQPVYTRDEWMDVLPTKGGRTQLPADVRRTIEDGMQDDVIDAAGGAFTMRYASVATAVRRL